MNGRQKLISATFIEIDRRDLLTMFKRIAILSLLLFGVCLISACSKTIYPNGFPKIFPCKVKVVDGDSPVEGVQVTLETDDTVLNKWGCAGLTGADGVATIRCRGFEGAPIGSFKVLLEKREPPVKEVSPGKYEAGNPDNQLDPDYADLETTPFSLDVTKRQKNVPTFDLADGSTK